MGSQGLRLVKEHPELPGKGHPITGIICGAVFGLFNWALLVFFLILLVSRSQV
jgi:hypothetical protein